MTAPSSTPPDRAAHERDAAAPRAAEAETPAAVRVTFVVLTALGGLLLLAPRQWVSAGMLLALSAALTLRHVVLSRRDAAAAPTGRPPGA